MNWQPMSKLNPPPVGKLCAVVARASAQRPAGVFVGWLESTRDGWGDVIPLRFVVRARDGINGGAAHTPSPAFDLALVDITHWLDIDASWRDEAAVVTSDDPLMRVPL